VANVSRIVVSVEPSMYAMPYSLHGQYDVRVSVEADGQRHTAMEHVREDDLRSRFDWLWDRLGRELRKHLGPTPEQADFLVAFSDTLEENGHQDAARFVREKFGRKPPT
jgi:hypothetical protein